MGNVQVLSLFDEAPLHAHPFKHRKSSPTSDDTKVYLVCGFRSSIFNRDSQPPCYLRRPLFLQTLLILIRERRVMHQPHCVSEAISRERARFDSSRDLDRDADCILDLRR